MKHLILFLFVMACALPAYSQKFSTEAGLVTFYSKVPLHSFEGNSKSLVGLINLEEKIVDFYLDLETLKTGNGKRDKDMRLTLNTDEYPFAEFYGTLVTDFDPEQQTAQEATVDGNFKIHGVSRKVSITGTLEPTPEGLLLKASWILNMEDHDIEPPKLLIMKVDEKQEIEIEVLLTPSTGEESE